MAQHSSVFDGCVPIWPDCWQHGTIARHHPRPGVCASWASEVEQKVHSNGLQPNCNGLQPRSDGLQATSDGLHPNSNLILRTNGAIESLQLWFCNIYGLLSQHYCLLDLLASAALTIYKCLEAKSAEGPCQQCPSGPSSKNKWKDVKDSVRRLAMATSARQGNKRVFQQRTRGLIVPAGNG